MPKFFSYKIKRRHRGLLRAGKGSVEEKTPEALEAYLGSAYPQSDGRWTHAEVTWHSSEAAAFKAERATTDAHERRTGRLPPWNSVRGGTGGSVYARCKAVLANGDICMHSALAGNYGYCGVHRR